MSGTLRPRPMLRGERTYLRPAERSDLPTFVAWLNDAETSGFLSLRAPLSGPLEEKWFERMLETQGKEAYHFTICRHDDDAPIGTIGIFSIDWTNGHAGIGISIGERQLWGKGYGTDAMLALIDFGFGELRLERLWLEVLDLNARARRSYEKCGFVLEGTERRAMFRHGRHHDVHLMAILRDEWAAQRRRRGWEYIGDD